MLLLRRLINIVNACLRISGKGLEETRSPGSQT
jgi:hypothetical protein